MSYRERLLASVSSATLGYVISREDFYTLAQQVSFYTRTAYDWADPIYPEAQDIVVTGSRQKLYPHQREFLDSFMAKDAAWAW